MFALVLIAASTVYADLNSHTKFFRFNAAQGVPADGSEIAGSSVKLTRSESALWLRANTTQLQPGVYTVWWGIFNNPANCTSPCDFDDLFDLTQRAAVQSSVLFATAGIAGDNGVAHFQAHLEEGELPTGPGQVGFGPGLLDAENAVVHLFVRYHGPVNADPNVLQRQMSHIAGGCVNPPPQETGQPGNDPIEAFRIFPCYDPLAAVFVP